MDFIIPELPQEVERYLSQYDDLFVRKEMKEHFRYYVCGMISETHRKNIQQIMAKVVEGKYQSGHHFLADSPWEAEEVNKRRLFLWQKDETTRMSKQGEGEEGWFIQDDTGQERRLRGEEKPEGEKRLKGGTDGVARQYIGNVGKVSEGMVFVSSHYADEKKRIPITTELYWPKASMERLPSEERTEKRKRDKIQIALDQLRWIAEAEAENVSEPFPIPKGVVADNWYGSSPKYLNTIHEELKWKYVVSIRPNRKIFIRLPHEKGTPEHHAEEVLALFKAEDFSQVSVMCSGGLKTKWVVEVSKRCQVKVKGLRHRPRLFLCVDDPSQLDLDPEKVDFLLCNSDSEETSLAEVVQANSLRNWEEVFYRQGKDCLGLDQCEAQLEQRLIRHWVLVMVAYTMLETFRVRGDLKDRTDKPLLTLEAVIRLLQDVFRWEFWMKWLKDEQRLVRFVEWFCETRGLKVSWSLS